MIAHTGKIAFARNTRVSHIFRNKCPGPDFLNKNGGNTPFQTARPRPYDNFNDDDSWGVTLQWEHEFDFAFLTVLYGHRALHELKDWVYNSVSFTATGNRNEDGVYTNVRLNHFSLGNTMYVGNGTSSHFDSVETHLTSKTTVASGDRLEWIVGGIAQDDLIAKYADPSFNVYWEELNTKTKALFGQATINLSGGLNFTGGLRHSWDDKNYFGNLYGRFGLIDFFIDPDTDSRYHRSYGWDETTYKANLSWQARLWGNNIFNSQQLRSISYTTSTNYDVRSGTISGQFVNPRTYGVSLTFNF